MCGSRAIFLVDLGKNTKVRIKQKLITWVFLRGYVGLVLEDNGYAFIGPEKLSSP